MRVNTRKLRQMVLGSVVGLSRPILFSTLLFLAVDLCLSSMMSLAPRIPDARQSLLEHFEDGWYELKKNFSTESSWGDKTFPVYTDEHGFRVGKKIDTKARIIFLGDSFTFAGVGPMEDTFVGMYQEATGIPVINAGVMSYSPTAYLHQYQKALRLEVLQPSHTVVVALDLSDAQDEASYWIDGPSHPIKRAESRVSDDSLGERPASVWAKKFKLSTGLAELVQRFALNYIRPPANVLDRRRSAVTWDTWEELDKTPAWVDGGYQPLGVAGGLSRVKEKIGEIADIARKHGSKVYVLVYPWPGQLTHEEKFSWSDYAVDVCLSAECAGVIDTFPDFRNYAATHRSWYSDLFVNGDVHYNRTGNEIIFNKLKRSLVPKD